MPFSFFNKEHRRIVEEIAWVKRVADWAFLKTIGERDPEIWSKFINFLPGDSAIKIRFLEDVLALKMAGCYFSLGAKQKYL
jgi:hypothetical protein